MPIISSISAGARAFGLYVVSALVTVIDTFNRSDNASDLGTISGQKWKIWRGIWGIATNKASSSTAASSYPLATLTFTRTDVAVGVSSPDAGTGMSFWVSDANNWYATVYVQQQVCDTCVNCNSWNASTCNAFCGGNCNAWTCNSATCSGTWNALGCAGTWNTTCNAYTLPCNVWNNPCQAANYPCVTWNNPCNAWRNTAPKGQCTSWGVQCNGRTTSCYQWGVQCNGRTVVCTSSSIGNCNQPIWSNCNAWFCNAASCSGNFNAVFCCGSFNTPNCNAFFSFSCNCVTQHRLNIIRSVASSVSLVVSTLWSSTIASFKTILSGSNATIQAYSASNYTSQLGSDSVQTLSSPQKNKRFGIIKAPSDLNQGSTIDEFRVE